MYCRSLELKDFRNYRDLTLRLPQGLAVFEGANASGKTSLLEALYLLATTRSPRAGSDVEMVNLDAQPEMGAPPFARIRADISRKDASPDIEMIITRDKARGDTLGAALSGDDDGQIGNGGGVARKRIKINGVGRRAIDLIGQINVVIFSPEDLELVIGAPAIRRRYLNITLSQIDHRYLRHLQDYERAVSQRNAFLRLLRERKQSRTKTAPLLPHQERESHRRESDELTTWNNEMVEHGAYIIRRRAETLRTLVTDAAPRHRHLIGLPDEAGDVGRMDMRYLPSFEVAPDADDAAIAIRFRDEIARLRQREIERATSLVGPHRDDFAFLIDGYDANVYGSRGQQRTVVLALKLAEVAFMERQTDDPPLLLLDDILSELDADRRAYVLTAVRQAAQQVLITTTDFALFGQITGEAPMRYRVAGGAVREITGS